MYKGKKLCVIVPAYNEELLIRNTLSGIPEYVDKIYVTDDCSIDDTAKIVKEIAATDSRVFLIQHKENQGVGGAIISGFKKAIEDDMELVSIMAGDDQMRPKHLPDLLDPIIAGKTEFTKGNRLKKGYWKGMSGFRLFGNKILTLLNKIVSGYWGVSDPQNGYIGISVDFLRRMDLDSMYKGYAFENDFMIKANIVNVRIKNVDIPAYYGEEQSKIKYGRFIVRTSWHLFKSYFWRFWSKYFKKFHFMSSLIILGLGALIGGLIWGIIISFGNIWSIILPCIGFVMLIASSLYDILQGYSLSRDMKK
ncbi:MAG: glycosyltransferase family 2 protein [Candidatus Heimdallarchaeota archaeon]